MEKRNMMKIYLGDSYSGNHLINYRFWYEAMEETHDYLTAYQPELLDKLGPFIFGVLRRVISVNEAISGIK